MAFHKYLLRKRVCTCACVVCACDLGSVICVICGLCGLCDLSDQCDLCVVCGVCDLCGVWCVVCGVRTMWLSLSCLRLYAEEQLNTEM